MVDAMVGAGRVQDEPETTYCAYQQGSAPKIMVTYEKDRGHKLEGLPVGKLKAM